jgi:pole hole protein
MDDDLGGGCSEDSSDWSSLSEELRNIQNHIRLTKEHIDALNARFAGYQNPPGIFLNEYEELTFKLHQFIMREQSLKVRLIINVCRYRYF